MHTTYNFPNPWVGYCHDLLISVHNCLALSPNSPLLYLLVPQAKYFAIHVDSWAWPLLTLPTNLFISPLLYCQYLLQGPLQCLSSVPETSKICFQGWVAFYLTLTTLNAGLNIWNQGLMQVKIFIASITYALNLLLDQPSHSSVSHFNQYFSLCFIFWSNYTTPWPFLLRSVYFLFTGSIPFSGISSLHSPCIFPSSIIICLSCISLFEQTRIHS